MTPSPRCRILVEDDDPDILGVLCNRLELMGLEVGGDRTPRPTHFRCRIGELSRWTSRRELPPIRPSVLSPK